MTALSKLQSHFKALREKATARPWEAYKTDKRDAYDEPLYEISGPRVVAYKVLERDMPLLTASCNAEEKLLAIIGVLGEALKEVKKHRMDFGGCLVKSHEAKLSEEALADANRLAAEIVEGK